MRNYLTREKEKIRNRWLYKIWEEEKGGLTMKDMTEMFGINLKTLYRVLEKEDKGRK